MPRPKRQKFLLSKKVFLVLGIICGLSGLAVVVLGIIELSFPVAMLGMIICAMLGIASFWALFSDTD